MSDFDIASLTALIGRKGSLRAVAAAVRMPYETLRDWTSGRRKPPSYVLSGIRVKIAGLPDVPGTALREPVRHRLLAETATGPAERLRLS